MIPASLTLVALMIITPSVIFALGFLQPAPGLVASVLPAGVAFVLVRRTDWRGGPDLALLFVALSVAAALTLMSGIGHFFWQTDDWMVRDAMLFDLVRHPWPVAYALSSGEGLLRAPLAMYLAPALAGKLRGVAIAQGVLFAQNALLLGLCVYLFARALPRGRTQFIGIAVFVIFSGLDAFAWVMLHGFTLGTMSLPHVESWAGYFQYSSNVTDIFWAPHHGLAGWALGAAYLVWRQGKISALTIGPIWAAAIFWSPLAAAGAIPFLVFAFLCDAQERKLRVVDFMLAAVAGLATLPVLFFLSRDAGMVEKGFTNFGNPQVLRNYVGLLFLEVAPYFTFAWHGRAQSDKRGLAELILIGVTLCAVPIYRLGFANDFAMRISIPALMLLCFRATPMLAALGQEPLPRRALVLSFVAIGAVTPAIEIYRNVSLPAAPASACNVIESLQDGPFGGSPIDYYIAAKSSFAPGAWLFKAPQTAPLSREIRNCWPGRRFVSGPPSPE